jgi:hypothetical protein
VEPHGGRLRVRCHTARYRVSDALPAPARSALDRALGASLADTLREVLADRHNDESLWLIRRLEVKACVGSSSPARRVASVLARNTAAVLERTLERGADGDAVLWFPDRSAFIARFFVDCADGRATGRWEYRQFEEVASRPSSVALRAVIGREPGPSLVAFARMAPADLRRVLRALTPPDADAVLDAFASLAVSTGSDQAMHVAEALRRMLDAAALPTEPHLAALALFIDVARSGASAHHAGTAARARDAAQLVAVLQDATDESALASSLAAGRWRSVRAADLERLAGLVQWPAPARTAAVDAVTRHLGVSHAAGAGRDGSDELSTPLGGMFLLLPLLDEIPWAAATAGWPAVPHLDDVDGSAVAQYLTVIAALGAHGNVRAVVDPVLRLALSIPPELDARAIGAWARALEPSAVYTAADRFIALLFRQGKLSGAVTLAALRDGVVAVDGARGLWLGTAAGSPAAIRELSARIGAAQPGAVFRGTAPWIDACVEPAAGSPVAIDDRFVARLDDQTAHATLGPPFDLGAPVQEIVMLAAQVLLRELAWRLPAFAAASLPYLSESILSFPATVRVEAERYIVHVGDPPLHLVLSLAGMNRRTFRVGTEVREWVLTREP